MRLAALLLAAALAAAACGGAASGPAAAPEGDGNDSAGFSDFTTTRTGAGLVAAGGRLGALGAERCSLARKVQLAFIRPDLEEFDGLGLGSLVIEDPWELIAAYTAEINSHGGIHGRCLQASIHTLSWVDPAASVLSACRGIPSLDPVVVLSLFSDVRVTECLAVQAQVPILGVYASVPATVQRRSRGKLFLDDGTSGYLLANSIDVARRSGIVSEGDKVGLLYGPPVGADASGREFNIGADFEAVVDLTGDEGLIPGVITHVPPRFGQLSLLSVENSVHLLQSDLTSSEQVAALAAIGELSAHELSAMAEIEDFYLAEATEQRDSGVDVVYATAPWFELRRMMRAAERIGWRPRWIASDIQGATLPLTGAPAAQADNFYLVSARRAAGDLQSDLDRGCVSLRNTAGDETLFEHRAHSDAWNVLQATCGALDVVVGALSRIDGAPSTDAFVAQLTATRYDAGFGGRLQFGPGDFSGADRFRVQRADPDCILEEWGCMRAVTDWQEPAAGAPQGQG